MRRAVLLLWRGIRLRCPNCGAGGLFRGTFKMVERCPACGLVLERQEQGYIVGAYMFNIIVAELAFVATFIMVLVSTWPNPPWKLLTYGGGLLMVLLPIAFYPFSKTLFLGFHLWFQPAELEETEEKRR